VSEASFPNRSQATDAKVAEQLDQRRLVEECAQLDPGSERAIAEEGLAADAAEWPR
jgi:hypothetical protein